MRRPQHGLPGLVQMFGIESPGLTSSLSLGEEVAGYLDKLSAAVFVERAGGACNDGSWPHRRLLPSA